MFNLGPFELVAIFVVALLVFGPEKLPEMGRQIGKAIKEFRKFQESMQGQVRDVLEPISGPIIPNGNVVGPQPTNIRGVIPTEVAESQKENVPKSATVQDPEEGTGEEVSSPPFGHYGPAGGAAAATSESATQAGETPPPSNPADESR